jgi:CheY-like chemotaxis protein
MTAKILWIDNDKLFLDMAIFRLQEEGHDVTQVYTVADGLARLSKGHYNLVILDVMMPLAPEEDALLPEVETDFGKKTGLVLYKRIRGPLVESKTPVLVFTIREDPTIREELQAAGLPAGSFMTKSEGADTRVLARKVTELLKKE